MSVSEQLISYSPWMKDKNWELQDKHLKKLSKLKIHFRHFKDGLELEKDSINILRGPRQIGKTTELKLIIQSFIRKKANPASIFYLPCDNIINRKELFENLTAITQYLKMEKINHGYLFLDEITSIKDWQKTIKGVSDAGQLSNVSVLITGSSAIEIKRGYERMPGRRGKGLDRVLLPMSFYDFCNCLGMKQRPAVDLFQVVEQEELFTKYKNTITEQESKYLEMLQLYLKHGGFPFIVSEIAESASLNPETEEVVSSIMFSEIEKAKLSINVLKSMLIKIASSLTTPISYNNIAKDSEIYSGEGAKKYLETLTAAFISFTVKSLDLNKKNSFPKKNIKIYLTDPVFINAINKFYGSLILDESKLAELLVAEHIVKIFSEQWAKFAGIDSLYYWQSKNNKEIDFVIYRDNKPFGFEVKYQNVVSSWDEMPIRKGLGKGVLVTKKTFEYGAVSKIPLWAFLLTQIKM